MTDDPHAGGDSADLHPPASGAKLFKLSLAALGIVYGDIGTSPLYALRECFHGEFGVEPTPQNVLGVLSLVFWSLLIVVTIKYLGLILRADNRGEGGVLALTALVRPGSMSAKSKASALALLGLFAAALLYGDGMITPAISVLSAVEGIEVVTPVFGPFVVPITILILLALFFVQRWGTSGVGFWFGPITLVWFAVLGWLGARQLVQDPLVLRAIVPWYALRFLASNGSLGFLVLGSVFLVVTGAEALYADMGHFGRRPIRLVWFVLVLPALLLNYFGQGALLLKDPACSDQPFYSMAPPWLLVPLVVLATLATIIASQAVISGAFSLTRQAVQLGYCPRMSIEHTSATEIGQVYVPEINWILMVSTILLVIGFGSSANLAAAYGVAVTTTMVISTLLFYALAREKWGWSKRKAVLPVALFLMIDGAFFGANMAKIMHGAWFPLLVAAVIFVLMTTWKRGRYLLHTNIRSRAIPLEEFQRLIATQGIPRVQGRAVFLNSESGTVPTALLHNLKHNKVLHESITVLTVLTEQVPRVERADKVEVADVGGGFHRVVVHMGFLEDPDMTQILALVREKGLELHPREVSFFLGRERVLPSKKPGMALWRDRVFAVMSRNALGATAYFGIPPDRVVELGSQVEI